MRFCQIWMNSLNSDTKNFKNFISESYKKKEFDQNTKNIVKNTIFDRNNRKIKESVLLVICFNLRKSKKTFDENK